MAAEKAAKRIRLQGASPAVFHTLEDFSQGSEQNKQRYRRLIAKFEERHGRKPDFLVRAPGRVNIIGEHIDYSGYAVLPMAIEQDVALACARNEEQALRLSNCSEAYGDHTGSTRVSPAVEDHEWHSYFLCGLKGAVDELGVRDAVGMDVMADGNVPPSAGLSSSSALVCCAALATAVANGVVASTKRELAELCARCERHIGTEGGGMDQAISFLGQKNKAMLIEFNPIRPSDVHLPSHTVFVISNTLVRANKVAFASFNERVVECRLAAMVVAKTKGLDWKNTRKLSHLQTALALKLSQMPEVLSACLHREAYTRSEVCSFLEISEGELKSEYLNSMTGEMGSFQLYKRALHVFEEAKRVYRFKEIANSSTNTANAAIDTANTSDPTTDMANMSDPSTDTASTSNAATNATTSTRDAERTAVQLGQLMDESHISCSQLYDCSCPQLDALVRVCKSHGALGSRLTGAGWGGCVVSLIRAKYLESFLKGVQCDYYEKSGIGDEVPSSALFATSPGPGAAVCDLS